MDIANVNSVVLSAKMQAKADAGGYKVTVVDKLLSKAIEKLIRAKPLWKFVVTDADAGGIESARATGFEVFEDGQCLGKMYKTYTRNDYRIAVENHRIAETRTRRSAYSTSNPDKAVTAVKKMFYKMNLSERSKKQAAEAERMVRDVVWTKQRSVQNLEGEIAGHAKRWALGDGYSAFLQYVNESDRRILETIDKKEAAFAEMLTVDDISRAYEKDRASLVIVEGNNFIIKRGENVGLVSANDLSDDMKAKIGMLKLVQDQQFVSTVGARVSVESYIVLDGANDDDGN
jgi:hypothetical protein